MTRAIPVSHRDELVVLSLIGVGLIAIIILIICGIFGWFESKATAPLPNWAENVLVAIGTAAILKLGDVLAALVTLATGRQVETMGARLADSTPTKRAPTPINDGSGKTVEEAAADGADQTATAARAEADALADQADQDGGQT